MAHQQQREFVEAVRRAHPEFFRCCHVLEIGSRIINGTVRDLFDGCTYLGVDWMPGPGVDEVCLAHEMPAPVRPFDTVICCEVFEHDPHFHLTVDLATARLRIGGLFVATWASVARTEHGTAATDDQAYGPDRTYYRPPSKGHFMEAASGRLRPLSLSEGNGGQDLYAVGFRAD